MEIKQDTVHQGERLFSFRKGVAPYFKEVNFLGVPSRTLDRKPFQNRSRGKVMLKTWDDTFIKEKN